MRQLWKIAEITPFLYLLSNIARLVENLKAKSNGGDIYIAAPTSEWPRMEEIAAEAHLNHDVEILFGPKLQEILDDVYGKCVWFDTWRGEVLSVVEQYILSGRDGFVHWPASSWSDRIRALRGLRKMDQGMTIIDIMRESVVDDTPIDVEFG